MRRLFLGLALSLVAPTLAAQVVGPMPAPDTTDVMPRYLRPAVGLHLGYGALEKAGKPLEVGATVELGAYRTPRLRFALGLNYMSADTERAQLDGSFSDLTLSVDLRYKPFQVRSVVPYIGAGVAGHLLRNDYADPNIADLYDGMAVGVQLFAGILVDGSATGGWGLSGELRNARAQNIDRTAFRAGVFLRL